MTGRRFYMTEEEAVRIINIVRREKPESFGLTVANKEVNRFNVILPNKRDGKGLDKGSFYGVAVSLLVVKATGDLARMSYGSIGEIYSKTPNSVWKRVVKYFQKEVNDVLTKIKVYGYIPSTSEFEYIKRIEKRVEEAIKEKGSSLTKVERVTKEQLGLSDKEWHLYQTSGSSNYKTDNGLERYGDDTLGVFLLAGKILAKDVHEYGFTEVEKKALLTYSEEVFPKLQRAKTNHKEIVNNGFKLLKALTKDEQEGNEVALKLVSSALVSALQRKELFKERIAEAQGFTEGYDKQRSVRDITTTIYKGQPQFLVTGNLNEITYTVWRGNTGAISGMDEYRGVTKVGSADNEEGSSVYRVTYTALEAILDNEDVDTKFITYSSGDWSLAYKVGSKVSLSLTPAIVDEIEREGEVSLLSFNKNRERTNMIGEALAVFEMPLIRYGVIDEGADDYFEEIEHIYNRIPYPETSYIGKVIRDWQKGYDIRMGNNTGVEKYENMANRIKHLATSYESAVVNKFNIQFGKNYNEISEIQDEDFGLDIGFVTIYYANKAVENEAKEFQKLLSDKDIHPDRIIRLPRVQSTTIKGFIASELVAILNQDLPQEFKLSVRSRLD